MSTEYYVFSGNERESLSFTPLLDGVIYNCQIKWNISAQRWYLNITDNSGNQILTTAMIESTTGMGINLISGIFSSTSMIWRQPNGRIEVTS
ncbi:TPA: phage baseplate plug family protein [Yersinia enterocolitica]